MGPATALAYAWEGESLAICLGTAVERWHPQDGHQSQGAWLMACAVIPHIPLSQSRDDRHNAGIISCPYFPFDRFRGGVLTNEKQGICANMYLPPQERHGPAAQGIFAHASLSLSG